MSDLLAALRRELHELECQVADGTADDEFAAQLEATVLASRIETLEYADGMARGVPMDGQAVA